MPSSTELQVVVSHVNPNRIALLHELARRWDKLLQDLWAQRKPTPAGEPEGPALPPQRRQLLS